MEMFKKRKKILSFAAAAVAFALTGAAWAGISGGDLNSDNTDVDLSFVTSYKDNSPKNPVTLGDSLLVTLTQNLILGDDGSVSGYAAEPFEIASEQAAGGAILVEEGRTLNINPMQGKRVSEKTSSKGSLRLFGSGTTNLSGSNSYSATFLQSGRLNVSSKEALGGSEVRLAGGATFGIVNAIGALDLSAVTIKLRRYDPSGNPEMRVTFDTGTRTSNTVKVDKLLQLDRYPGSAGNTGDEITLVKDGLGTLTISGVTEHSGGTVINAGTLELGSPPMKTQVVEISADAELASNVNLLTNITLKPHSNSTVSVPAIRGEAAVRADETGEAALLLAGVDSSALRSFPFLLKANLEGLKKPAGPDEDFYYVKLLNSPSHGLLARDVSVVGVVPPGFSTYYYSVSAFTDSDNVYALLSREADIFQDVFDVTAYNASQSGNIVTVVVNNRSNEPFAPDASFEYRFIAAESGSTAADPVTAAIFSAMNVQFNEARTKASFQIDLSNLADDDGVRQTLIPGRFYVIAVDGADGAGVSTVRVNAGGDVVQPTSDQYSVTLEVSADVVAGTVSARAYILYSDRLVTDGKIVNFYLCDMFGDPVRISGFQAEHPVYAQAGFAVTAYEKIPAGRYLVKISSPEFAATRYSSVIEITGARKGGGGGCDSGAGVFALAAIIGSIAVRRKR